MENPFWAYIHRDEKHFIRIKHLYTPVNGLNDLEHAKEEVKAGNDLIWYLFPDIIWALDMMDARTRAENMLRARGWKRDNNLEWCRPNPPRSRFENLEIE